MGAKDSKRSACLSYEDAVKRMSDVEYKRVCEAFKRLAGNTALLNKAAFIQNVLGDGVPTVIAEWLYGACGGGPKGIGQRDLICGLVLLTRGTEDEKIRFLWSLYSNDAGTFILRSDLKQALCLEGAPTTQATLAALFGPDLHHDRITFDAFRACVQHNREATVLSKWLLTTATGAGTGGDAAHISAATDAAAAAAAGATAPTFYQSLAGVTHLVERDIGDLEKSFWAVQAGSASAQLDRACLMALVSPPVPAALCHGLFLALDENLDGHIDFKELCCGISAACRGPKTERMKFCFKIFDVDRDNRLNATEFAQLRDTLNFVAGEHAAVTQPGLLRRSDSGVGSSQPTSCDDGDVACVFDNEAFINCDSGTTTTNVSPTLTQAALMGDDGMGLLGAGNGDDLTMQDFLVAAVAREDTIDPLLQLLFEVGHVALGLRPQCRHLEREIVLGWQERERRRGYRVGQYWYLVATDWWQHWLAYSGAAAGACGTCAPACGRVNNLGVAVQVIGPQQLQQEDSFGSGSSNQSASTDSMGDLLGGGGNGNHRMAADNCSLASSSGVSSGSAAAAAAALVLPVSPPGPIDNAPLIAAHPNTSATPNVPTLTGEGGRLKMDTMLSEHRDFVLVPDSLWKALAMWYGGSLPLPRQVILAPGCADPELELYPLNLRILRHQLNNGASAALLTSSPSSSGGGGVTGSPRRYLANTAAFSRLATVRQVAEFLATPLNRRPDEVRLWLVRGAGNLLALEDDDAAEGGGTLQEMGVRDGDQLLLEVRNADLTWPEELGALATASSNNSGTTTTTAERRATIALPAGATGLHNLGNTCFMNSALQAVSNTRPLTQYFLRDVRLRELNVANPMGTRGQVARRYAELVRELWSGTGARSVAPLKLRWCVSRHAPDSLGGGGQHDSQELLAWLLDALHEDLNRVAAKPYHELRDSDGRPDAEVAAEAWRLHSARDHSVVTDLFYGQLKSKVRCCTCGHESVRFDAFNLLSLPLPMESSALCEVLLLRQSGEVPERYGVRLPHDARYAEVKAHLSQLCGVRADQMLLTVLAHAQIQRRLADDARVHPATAMDLVAFELPPGATHTSSDADVIEDERQGTTKAEPAALPLSTRSPEVRASSALCMPNILCFKNNVDRSGDAQQRRRTPSIVVRPFTDAPAPTLATPTFLVAVHRKSLRQETYFLAQHKAKPSLFGVPMLLGCDASTTCQGLYESAWRQVARLLSPAPQAEQANHATDCDDSLGYEFPFTLKAVLPGGQICALCHWTNFCRGCAIPCCAATNLMTLCAGGPASFLVQQQSLSIAIDWDPTALHLRYQASREKEWTEDGSLQEARRLHTEPIDLDHCLRAFTQEERLEAKYHCGRCKDKQPATKKLQIWRLPPILIVHLKRFDRVNDKWVKTQKVVNFPFRDFDPTAYLAAVPQQTILRHRQLQELQPHHGCDPPSIAEETVEGDVTGTTAAGTVITAAGTVTAPAIGTAGTMTPVGTVTKPAGIVTTPAGTVTTPAGTVKTPAGTVKANGAVTTPAGTVTTPAGIVTPAARLTAATVTPTVVHLPPAPPLRQRERLESTSLLRTPVVDEDLQDFHQHHLGVGQDAFDLRYQLYAVVSHSGQLNGGHYISYACNPNGHWYCYNDSSCREIPRIDTSAAYILFYERRGLDYRPYLPDVDEGGGGASTADTLDGCSVASDHPSSISGGNGAANVMDDAAVGGSEAADQRRQFCRLQ